MFWEERRSKTLGGGEQGGLSGRLETWGQEPGLLGGVLSSLQLVPYFPEIGLGLFSPQVMGAGARGWPVELGCLVP
jgi:hypothetical protein